MQKSFLVINKSSHAERQILVLMFRSTKIDLNILIENKLKFNLLMAVIEEL